MVACIVLCQKHSSTEVIYEHHTPHHPHSIPRWRVAYLALQRELGLRSQRRARRDPVSLGHFGVDWSDLTGGGKALPARRPAKFCCAYMIFAAG